MPTNCEFVVCPKMNLHAKFLEKKIDIRQYILLHHASMNDHCEGEKTFSAEEDNILKMSSVLITFGLLSSYYHSCLGWGRKGKLSIHAASLTGNHCSVGASSEWRWQPRTIKRTRG